MFFQNISSNGLPLTRWNTWCLKIKTFFCFYHGVPITENYWYKDNPRINCFWKNLDLILMLCINDFHAVNLNFILRILILLLSVNIDLTLIKIAICLPFFKTVGWSAYTTYIVGAARDLECPFTVCVVFIAIRSVPARWIQSYTASWRRSRRAGSGWERE